MKVKVRDCTKVTVLALLMLGLIPKCIVEVILRLKVCERNSKMIIFLPCDPAEVDGGALDCVLTVGHLVIPSTPSHLHVQNENGMRILLTQAACAEN